MKKNIFILILLFTVFLFSGINAFAEIPTPTAQVNNEQIDDLKTKIASRVAQLKLVEKRGTLGSVTDSSNTQITLSTLDGQTRFIDVDELTKFSSPSSKTFGISDIKKGMNISVIGLYNKQSRRILARVISTVTIPKIAYGTVSTIDTKNHTFLLVTENEKLVIDVETITKTSSYSKELDEQEESGFSKIKTQDNAYVIGYTDTQNKNQLLASKILLFPDFPNNPKIIVAPEALKNDPTIVPSTGSGKKLTPIVND
ncbi:MAG: hypothetical protein M1450_04365 [Patescibacteria group bacterium]|nr:hypothetical protein [Patescibacteria group bacterium]